MSNVIKDRAKFLMPRSRELQFPAMAVMQSYVNDYQKKTYFLGMQQKGTHVDLEYCVDIAPSDWQMFLDVGLELNQQPINSFDAVDLLVDFTEDRLNRNWRKDQHVAQIYGTMVGVETTVLPKIKQIRPGEYYGYLLLDGLKDSLGLQGMREITGEQLICLKDGEIKGIIGNAGWETYLACAMGLSVIEIKPPDRHPQYLSKWICGNYRMVDGGGNIIAQIKRAISDLERTPCITAQAETPTGPTLTVQ